MDLISGSHPFWITGFNLLTNAVNVLTHGKIRLTGDIIEVKPGLLSRKRVFPLSEITRVMRSVRWTQKRQESEDSSRSILAIHAGAKHAYVAEGLSNQEIDWLGDMIRDWMKSVS